MRRGGRLTIEMHQEGDWQRILFAGPVTEEAKPVLMPVASAAGPKCILDLGGVSQLNSIGIRDWAHFLKALKPGRELVFERLPDEVVRTMNMVTNFGAKVPVRSVFREYGCESCGHEQAELFVEGKDFKVGELPRTGPRMCVNCGQATEAFEADGAFFAFLLGA